VIDAVRVAAGLVETQRAAAVREQFEVIGLDIINGQRIVQEN